MEGTVCILFLKKRKITKALQQHERRHEAICVSNNNVKLVFVLSNTICSKGPSLRTYIHKQSMLSFRELYTLATDVHS